MFCSLSRRQIQAHRTRTQVLYSTKGTHFQHSYKRAFEIILRIGHYKILSQECICMRQATGDEEENVREHSVANEGHNFK